MSERDHGYPAGVPCWVDTLQPDPEVALEFYGRLLGWEFTEPGPMPGDLPGQYFVARIQGRDVAGIGSTPGPDGSPSAFWNTYVRVDSIEKTVESAQRLGGRVLLGPLDALPAGRLAVLADLSGAAVCVWEPYAREGAQLVNEPGTWTMSSLHTYEANRAREFYGAVFGWQATPGTHVVRWRLPGYVGGEPEQPFPRDIVAVMAPSDEAASTPPVPPHWNVNFRVDDTDATADDATRLGGKVIVPPQDTAIGLRSAALADPKGAAFSISS